MVKNPPANAGDAGSIPGSGRSPEDANGNLLPCSCLGNSWTEEPSGLNSPSGHKESNMTLAAEHALLNKQRNAKWRMITVLNLEVTMISNPCDLNLKWL